MVKRRSPSLDDVFHALAHPARRAILGKLAQGESNLTDLVAPLKMSFPAASKHVRVLEKARLLTRRVVGRDHMCRIEGKPMAIANEYLDKFREIWEPNFARLDSLLEEMKQTQSHSP
jgi:DNA-binding transcriptional ArsR family regulator